MHGGCQILVRVQVLVHVVAWLRAYTISCLYGVAEWAESAFVPDCLQNMVLLIHYLITHLTLVHAGAGAIGTSLLRVLPAPNRILSLATIPALPTQGFQLGVSAMRSAASVLAGSANLHNLTLANTLPQSQVQHEGLILSSTLNSANTWSSIDSEAYSFRRVH